MVVGSPIPLISEGIYDVNDDSCRLRLHLVFGRVSAIRGHAVGRRRDRGRGGGAFVQRITGQGGGRTGVALFLLDINAIWRWRRLHRPCWERRGKRREEGGEAYKHIIGEGVGSTGISVSAAITSQMSRTHLILFLSGTEATR